MFLSDFISFILVRHIDLRERKTLLVGRESLCIVGRRTGGFIYQLKLPINIGETIFLIFRLKFILAISPNHDGIACFVESDRRHCDTICSLLAVAILVHLPSKVTGFTISFVILFSASMTSFLSQETIHTDTIRAKISVKILLLSILLSFQLNNNICVYCAAIINMQIPYTQLF